MALREFTDSQGRSWRIWDVHSSKAPVERRTRDRRNPDPVLRHRGEERRSGQDRRKDRSPRGLVPLQNWLAFECETDKRRLAPIPEKWEEMGEPDLEMLAEQAQRVERVFSRN